MTDRSTCEHRARCGTTGHYLENGQVVRCPCLEDEIRRRILGQMYSPRPKSTSALSKQTANNLLIEGPITSVKTHVSTVLLGMRAEGKNWLTLDAYRLIEIFLGEDKEHESQHEAIDPDLLILLLGFADPRNKYLPELLMQVLARRELLSKPTWVILGIPKETISTKYNSDLANKLATFQKVSVT